VELKRRKKDIVLRGVERDQAACFDPEVGQIARDRTSASAGWIVVGKSSAYRPFHKR
jgi:hypothetical protein